MRHVVSLSDMRMGSPFNPGDIMLYDGIEVRVVSVDPQSITVEETWPLARPLPIFAPTYPPGINERMTELQELVNDQIAHAINPVIVVRGAPDVGAIFDWTEDTLVPVRRQRGPIKRSLAWLAAMEMGLERSRMPKAA